MKGIILFVLALVLCSISSAEAQSPECIGCETVIGFLELYVTRNASEEYVLKILDKICQYAGYDYNATCEAAFAYGITNLINWIKNSESADQVCVQLGVCSSEDDQFQDYVSRKKSVQSDKSKNIRGRLNIKYEDK